MEFVLIGLAVFFNIVVLKWKFDKGRYADALLDAVLLGGVMFVFSGTYGALVVGTIASALVSIYLLFSPIKIDWDKL